MSIKIPYRAGRPALHPRRSQIADAGHLHTGGPQRVGRGPGDADALWRAQGRPHSDRALSLVGRRLSRKARLSLSKLWSRYGGDCTPVSSGCWKGVYRKTDETGCSSGDGRAHLMPPERSASATVAASQLWRDRSFTSVALTKRRWFDFGSLDCVRSRCVVYWMQRKVPRMRKGTAFDRQPGCALRRCGYCVFLYLRYSCR